MRAASLSAALSSPRVGLTFASQRAHRLKAIIVFCHSTGCRRSDAICFDASSNRIVIPDIAPLLKCSACGGKRITVMTNMREYYAICRARKLGVP